VADAVLIQGATPRLKFSARLTAKGKPVAGQEIQFVAPSPVGAAGAYCYAYTNSNGVAECSGATQIVASVVALGYDAYFNPWYGIYAPSFDHGDLVG
jgi:hypothetical protein